MPGAAEQRKKKMPMNAETESEQKEDDSYAAPTYTPIGPKHRLMGKQTRMTNNTTMQQAYVELRRAQAGAVITVTDANLMVRENL